MRNVGWFRIDIESSPDIDVDDDGHLDQIIMKV